MDIKTERRNFYHNKTYLSDKYDEEYTTERFDADLQCMLDEFIPNATVRNLTKFMEKKYNRILKKYPEVQKPLRKILQKKFNNISTQIKQVQTKKIMQFIKEGSENMEFIVKGQNEYEFTQKGNQDFFGNWKDIIVEGVTIKLPMNMVVAVDQTQKEIPGKGFYTITCSDKQKNTSKRIASAEMIEKQKFDVNRGNFDREANNFLEKLNHFYQRMNQIENPENPEQ